MRSTNKSPSYGSRFQWGWLRSSSAPPKRHHRKNARSKRSRAHEGRANLLDSGNNEVLVPGCDECDRRISIDMANYRRIFADFLSLPRLAEFRRIASMADFANAYSEIEPYIRDPYARLPKLISRLLGILFRSMYLPSLTRGASGYSADSLNKPNGGRKLSHVSAYPVRFLFFCSGAMGANSSPDAWDLGA